ncbi:MAG: hypothetical protein GY811_21830 [Myxococcales bacterium]|nr:hypothetical protein [Myxococcales bacterium]
MTDAPAEETSLGTGGVGLLATLETRLGWPRIEGVTSGFGRELQARRYAHDAQGFLDFEVPLLESVSLASESSHSHIAQEEQRCLWRVSDDGFDGTTDTETYAIALSNRSFATLEPTNGDVPSAVSSLGSGSTRSEKGSVRQNKGTADD